jgi:thiol-disulfide isomerase/thioredoxin
MYNLGQTVIVGEKVSKVTAIDYSSQYPDLLTFQLHSNGVFINTQLWIDPGHVRIDATVSGKEIIIDSVYNSPTYLLSKRFRSEYGKHLKDSSDHRLFLSRWYDKAKSSAFSIQIAKTIIYWSQNDKATLIELKNSLINSPSEVTQNALFEPTISHISGLIGSDKIDLTGYTFLDSKGFKTKLDFGIEKITLIDFWYTTCPPCIEQHRLLAEVFPELKKNNIRVVGVSTDKSIEKWKSYLKKNPDQNWIQLHVGEGESIKNIETDLGLRSFPTYLLVDDKGGIIKFRGSLDEVLHDIGIQ